MFREKFSFQQWNSLFLVAFLKNRKIVSRFFNVFFLYRTLYDQLFSISLVFLDSFFFFSIADDTAKYFWSSANQFIYTRYNSFVRLNFNSKLSPFFFFSTGNIFQNQSDERDDSKSRDLEPVLPKSINIFPIKTVGSTIESIMFGAD